ncbi:cytokine receptor family member B16 isoform X2 [Silurus meridionalis]|uniref:Fibronectin type-III domain-containing protein n=1 Tax=Silurus meridionalis TaxID=175797 RepID=A0A8T0AKL8_SILME|nr:cytokine receptor family member B16 isoform X2 [Silurus meridionalis]KAF7692343.1 hypothetical protein HF521_009953 [Silurus meridionalis]
MCQMRNLLKTVTSAYLIFSLSHAALLPASLNIWIQSENMRHILKWSSLQETCPFVNYTVKYQGEFEHMQNTWLDAHSCNEIVHTECDLTLDLSSDSDYNIRVLARCGDSTLWTQLSETFNRRDTVLLAPDMSVNLNRGRIEGYFSELPNHINVNVRIWKKGDEKNAFVKEITDQKFHHDVQQGDEGIYCVSAEVTLDITNRSNSTREHCIPVWDLRPSWPIFLAVGIVVALTLAVALILGLITPRCSLWLRRFVHKKEPLPNALLGWTKSTPILSSKILLELTHSVLLLDPSKEQDRMSETTASVNLFNVKTNEEASSSTLLKP